MKSAWKVAVIGAGPAGIACAVQLKRAGIIPMVFEQGRIGGLLNNAYRVENYPGFPEGISGPSLVRKFKKQMQQWHIRVIHESVGLVSFVKGSYMIKAKKDHRADFLVIASGTRPIMPELALDLDNEHIIFDVYPIVQKRMKTIAIVGSGDAAFDYALNLCRHNRVYIINRSQHVKALDLLQERVKNAGRKRIIRLNKTWIKKIGDTHRGLSLMTNRRDIDKVIICNYLLYAIGRKPAKDFLGSGMGSKTSKKERLFFIGDVQNADKRQTAIAVGDGVNAAMEIIAMTGKQENADKEENMNYRLGILKRSRNASN